MKKGVDLSKDTVPHWGWLGNYSSVAFPESQVEQFHTSPYGRVIFHSYLSLVNYPPG